MSSVVEDDEKAVANQADDIAIKLTEFLIAGFKEKTGRDPSNSEIEQLFDELTTERVAELLGEEITTGDQGNVVGDGDESGDDEDGDDNNDDEDDDNKLEDFNETTAEDAAENVQDVAVEFCKILASTEEKDRTTEAENVCVTAGESKIIENISEVDENDSHDQKRLRQT